MCDLTPCAFVHAHAHVSVCVHAWSRSEEVREGARDDDGRRARTHSVDRRRRLPAVHHNNRRTCTMPSRRFSFSLSAPSCSSCPPRRMRRISIAAAPPGEWVGGFGWRGGVRAFNARAFCIAPAHFPVCTARPRRCGCDLDRPPLSQHANRTQHAEEAKHRGAGRLSWRGECQAIAARAGGRARASSTSSRQRARTQRDARSSRESERDRLGEGDAATLATRVCRVDGSALVCVRVVGLVQPPRRVARGSKRSRRSC